jgi:hypothetical protein
MALTVFSVEILWSLTAVGIHIMNMDLELLDVPYPLTYVGKFSGISDMMEIRICQDSSKYLAVGPAEKTGED